MLPNGPNVRRLVIHKMVLLAIPPGCGDGLRTGIEFFQSGKIGEAAREATDWAMKALAAVKNAPGNPYGDDDEAIAGEILRQVVEKKKRDREIRQIL